MDIDMNEYHAEMRRRLRHAEEQRQARALEGVYDEVPSLTGTLMAGKDVLITGASGFLGRVLLEKLLRSCPEVGTVFLLLRPRRGVPALERVHDIVNVPLFEQLVREQPSALSKIVAVAGDCSELGLGLSDEDRDVLRERVAFVFHGAASVRFDDPLQKAVRLNTRGTREVVDLCSGMRKLEALVHISTAYTNINQNPVGEKLYPSPVDWRVAIESVTNDDTAKAMDYLGPKLLSFHPNSYTFSKSLGEHIMGEASKHLPVIIVRPAIVIGAAKEPLPGWLDTVNSPAAMWAAINKGVIRACKLYKDDVLQDYVPVDMVAKATIVAAYVAATRQLENGKEVPIVNIAISDVHAVPGWMMHEIYTTYCRRATPYSSAIRYPFLLRDTNWLVYSLCHFFYHLLFSFFMDLALRVAGQEPRLLKIHRKLTLATSALRAFTEFRSDFTTTNFWKIQSMMHPSDVKDFDFDLDSLDPRKDCKNQMVGILEYAFKEKFDKDKGLQHINRLFWLETALYTLFTLVALYVLKLRYLA